ncbi:MAG: hypothetical protein ABI877_16800, partial [Gemmatimonadaceae bacterium]
PINGYDVSLNIGKYVHFSDTYNWLTLDYYVFPEDLELTPIVDEYLRHAAIPVLELKFEHPGKVQYRWKASEKDFRMPVDVGKSGAWTRITPTAEWQTMPTSLDTDDFTVATDYFYVGVSKS